MKKHCSWRIVRCDAQVNLTFYFSIETYFINKISLKKKKSQGHDPCTQKVYSDTLKVHQSCKAREKIKIKSTRESCSKSQHYDTYELAFPIS